MLIIAACSFGQSVFSQSESEEPLLGLPGDDLDLYAVLDLFQDSKTIEDFEKSLNTEENGINNLDLNNDGNVDFIKVETVQDGDDFLFILQDPVSENETQDVAVISLDKDDAGNVTLQIIGDESLYGKDYIIEPITTPMESVTANPGYVGSDPVTTNVQATTEVIVVEAVPVVQYVYSPYYVHYYPTYYYGYYPYYYRPYRATTIAIYRHRHYHYHHRYHHHHHKHHHNHHHYASHYNKSTRNSSSTVNNNIKAGNYPTAGQGNAGVSTNQSNRATTGNATSTNQSTKNSAGNTNSTNPSTGQNKNNYAPSTSQPSSTGTTRSTPVKSGGQPARARR